MKHNRQQIVDKLREIADLIDAGDFGELQTNISNNETDTSIRANIFTSAGAVDLFFTCDEKANKETSCDEGNKI